MALYLVRERRPAELPTTWDAAEGRAVRWSGWSPPHRIFVCPPPPEPDTCCNCGQAADEETATGYIQPLPADVVEEDRVVASKRRPGSTWGRTVKRLAHEYLRLLAFRCPACGHVDIYDEHTKELTHDEPEVA